MKHTIKKNKIKNLIFLLIFCFIGGIGTGNTFATEGSNQYDLLQQAFDPAIQTQSIVGGDSIGTTTESVGNYVLHKRTKATISLKNGINTSKQDSLLVTITRLILRLTIILSITMIIYNGIQYMIKSSKGENPKDILNNIYYIIGGVLLALSSVMIIRLISSIGISSLGEIL